MAFNHPIQRLYNDFFTWSFLTLTKLPPGLFYIPHLHQAHTQITVTRLHQPLHLLLMLLLLRKSVIRIHDHLVVVMCRLFKPLILEVLVALLLECFHALKFLLGRFLVYLALLYIRGEVPCGGHGGGGRVWGFIQCCGYRLSGYGSVRNDYVCGMWVPGCA